jgi:diguanylate cyclase (GGDEF)-like protein/PAS domain S-box-containing protein
MCNQADLYLSALIDRSQDLLWAVDLDCHLTAFNDAFRKNMELAFGIEPTVGMCPHDLMPSERALLWTGFYERARRDGTFQVEYSFVAGSAWGLAFKTMVFSDETIGVSVFGAAITDRQLSNCQLVGSDARFRKFFDENSSVMLLVEPASGEIVAANRAASVYYGLPQDQVIGIPTRTVSTSPPEAIERNMEYALRGERSVFNYRIQLASGEERDVETYTTPCEVDGKTLLYAIVHDVTERRRIEMALEEARTKYRDIYEGALEGMFQTTIEGQILAVNPALAKMLGYESPEDLLTSVKDLAREIWQNPDERSRYVETLLERGSVRGYECRFRRKDGTIIWVLLNGQKKLAPDAKVTYHEGFIVDITERKRAEQSIRESAESLEEAQRIGCLGSYVLDISAQEWISSSALDELFGTDKKYDRTVAGWLALIHPDDREMMVNHSADVFSGKLQQFDMEYRIIRRSDHAERWVHGLGRLEFDHRGNPRILRGVIKDITAHKLSEIALRDNEQRFRQSFEQAAVGMIHTSLEGRILRVNNRFAEIVGYSPGEIAGITFQQITAPEDLDKSNTALKRMTTGLADLTQPSVWEKRYIRKDGSLTWVKLTISIQRDGEGRALHYITIVEDINQRKAAEANLSKAQEALRLSEERYRTVFQTSLDCIVISRLGDGKYVDVNTAFLKLLGFEYDEVIGRTSFELDLWADAGTREDMTELLRRDSSFHDYKTRFRKKSGEISWVLISASVIEIEGNSCVLSVMRDISDAKAAEEEIWNLAFYDPLTRLPNRRLLLDRLHQSLAVGNRTLRHRALLFVDLDDFKTLNDTLGHQTGDLLLQEVAARLSKSVRECDTVARLGGDEFVVMLEDLSVVPEEAATEAEAVGEKMLFAIDQPYLLDGHECLSTSSVGITVFGHKQQSANEVLQQADIAMYQAKAAGRNTMRFFAPALQAAVKARAAIEAELRQALKTGQFVLYYQPQVDDTGLIGVEALIRWMHPERGLLAPGKFISIAEHSGLILPLGEWVLATAADQIAAWARRAQTANISISVNISALQFRQPGFVSQVLATLDRAGANPKRLKLELTESMLVDNIEDVIGKITDLKSQGIGFSLDDFGTGYSSLAYLKRLPIDQLKIDRSFVRDIVENVGSRAIAQSIISLGRAMCLGVIAEGVETEEQRDCLIQLGCDTFQGYLFSCPLPLEEFEQRLPVLDSPEDRIPALVSMEI